MTPEKLIENSGTTAAINYEPDSIESEDGAWTIVIHGDKGSCYGGRGYTLREAILNSGFPTPFWFRNHLLRKVLQVIWLAISVFSVFAVVLGLTLFTVESEIAEFLRSVILPILGATSGG